MVARDLYLCFGLLCGLRPQTWLSNVRGHTVVTRKRPWGLTAERSALPIFFSSFFVGREHVWRAKSIGDGIPVPGRLGQLCDTDIFMRVGTLSGYHFKQGLWPLFWRYRSWLLVVSISFSFAFVVCYKRRKGGKDVNNTEDVLMEAMNNDWWKMSDDWIWK